MTDFYTMEPMHYWAHASSMSASTFRERVDILSKTGKYLISEKFDGNFSRAIINPNGESVLQTRGISKKTGKYGEIQDKVFWWESVTNAFSNLTVILGEVYLPNGIDKDVGSILRSLTPRALSLQKEVKLEWRIFDILCYEGKELMNTPFEERIKYIPDALEKIHNPLVTATKYEEMDETLWDKLSDVFSRGGEGMVAALKTMKYEPGKRGPHAWDTIKLKQEIGADVDVFITRTEAAVRDYTGKEISVWKYWEDMKTGEKLFGEYYPTYAKGERMLRPVSKGYYHGWPGAVYCGVYNKNGDIIEICKVAGLTDEMKTELRDNFKEWYMACLSLGGMMVSTATDEISIRHPYIKSIRKGDLNPSDCTLSKIIGD